LETDEERKKKQTEYRRAYRAKNPEKYKQATRDWYLKNKDRHNANNKAYYEKNREQQLEYFKQWYDKKGGATYRREIWHRNKEKLILILGGFMCNCDRINCWHKDKCTVIDSRCLQIGHKNGDGKIDRERFKKKQDALYRYYISHPEEAKEKLEITCSNCNWIRRQKGALS
jgi:hypothetical protein